MSFFFCAAATLLRCIVAANSECVRANELYIEINSIAKSYVDVRDPIQLFADVCTGTYVTPKSYR